MRLSAASALFTVLLLAAVVLAVLLGSPSTKAAMPVNGEVRLASNTKTFTAATVLQLVGEGKIDLNKSVQRCGKVRDRATVSSPGSGAAVPARHRR